MGEVLKNILVITSSVDSTVEYIIQKYEKKQGFTDLMWIALETMK